MLRQTTLFSIDSEVIMTGGSGKGSTNTAIRVFTTTEKDTGAGLYWNVGGSAAANGHNWTILVAGLYAIDYSDYNATEAVLTFGISVNSNQLSTLIENITASHRRAITTSPIYTGSGRSYASHVSIVTRLAVGDVVRAHTHAVAGTPDGTSTGLVRFSMRRICD